MRPECRALRNRAGGVNESAAFSSRDPDSIGCNHSLAHARARTSIDTLSGGRKTRIGGRFAGCVPMGVLVCCQNVKEILYY